MNLDQSNMVTELNLSLFCANFWSTDSFFPISLYPSETQVAELIPEYRSYWEPVSK